MADIAGSVVISIGGDLSAFEAALARAKEQAVAFDAQISAKLSGVGLSSGLAKIAAGVDSINALLTKLTTSGTAAGATMARLVTSTQPVATALQTVSTAAAQANAGIASIGSGAGAAAFTAGTISAKDFAAALEATGGNLSRITPAMLGIAESEGVMTAATLEATAAFRGLTEAQVQAFAAQQAGTNFRNSLNESFGLINNTTKSARDSAAVFRELAVAEDGVAGASRGAAAGMESLGVASAHTAGLGAGVTREFSVLGAEVARGNFSRIPGSLIVLNERLVSTGTSVLTLSNFMKAFGGLASVIFNPYVIGFLGLTIGLDLAAKAFSGFGSGISDVNTVLENHKKLIDEITSAYPAAGDAAKAYEEQAAKIPTVVAAADTKEAIEANKDLIQSYLTDISSRLSVTGNDFALFGSAGSDAFMQLGDEIKNGSISIGDVQTKLGELRIDPALNKNAHEFASSLQDSANKAAELELKLRGVGAAANVFAGSTVGRGDEGANIIANMVSAGNAAADALKNVQDSADTSGMTSYARAIANINLRFDDMIVKAHASGAALDTFNQARNLSVQEASLKALSGISFDQAIGGANEFGVAISRVGSAAAGVKVEIGNIAEPIINITQLFGQAKLDQLIGINDATQKLEGFKSQIVDIKDQLDAISNLPPDALFGIGDKGTQADITNAYDAIDQIFKRYDSGTASVRAVHDAIEQVRASLIALGGDNASVNEFINSIVQGQEKVRQLTGDVQTLSNSIAHLPDKTVTITVRTQQVGSGTQSIYDVPNSSGGTSGVGVTRYGGVPGQQSGPSMSAYQVPSTGYGSQGGSGDSPMGTVNVTRFATGGVIHPGDTQQVSFFKSPDETVAIFTPQQRSALANPQSGYTGTEATKENDRYWVVLMNIEAATQKTAQLLDDIKTAGLAASSGLSSGGSSSAGGSSQGDAQFMQYLQALGTARANYAAIGGGGPVGYGSSGLGASPEQIAYAVTYGGMSSVGNPTGGGSLSSGGAYSALHGGDPNNALLNGLTPGTTQYAQAYAQALAKTNGVMGFATGGIDSSDTQKVEFFKNPNEKVIIATPQQFADVRPGSGSAGSSGTNDNRPIVINQTHNWNGNTPPSPASQAEIRRQTALGIRDALRSVNGR